MPSRYAITNAFSLAGDLPPFGNYILTVPKDAMLPAAQAEREHVSQGLAALPVCLCQENPNRLVSLREIMERFEASMCCQIIATMMRREQVASTSPPRSKVPQAWVDEARGAILLGAKLLAVDAGLTETAELATRIDRDFQSPVLVEEFQYSLMHLRELMGSEMSKQLFLTIPIESSKLYEQEQLFGDVVYGKFKRARVDIKAAGTALACRLGTASIFHLMRAAEYGLRALALDRRIRLPKKAVLDLATWEDIIRQLEAAEVAIQNYPKTLAREAQFEFYHGAMMEFKRFKNKFRNRIMHSRDEYDPDEARGAFTHVGAFMRILAS